MKRSRMQDKKKLRPKKTERKRARVLEGVREIDYQDFDLLRRCMTEYGKIMPARLTGANALQQRRLARAIRRARVMGLLR